MLPQTKRMYASMGALAVLLAGFGFLAEDVLEGETQAFDDAILYGLRVPGKPETPIGPSWLVEAARDVTALGSFSVLGILVTLVVVYLLLAGNRGTAILIGATVVSGATFSTLIKQWFDRPRPELTGVAKVFTASFPSGHAMVGAVSFLAIGAVLAAATKDNTLRAYYIGAAIALTLLVGLSRIYLGVHYPTDVFAGWCLGAAWALFCFILADILRQMRASGTHV